MLPFPICTAYSLWMRGFPIAQSNFTCSKYNKKAVELYRCDILATQGLMQL